MDYDDPISQALVQYAKIDVVTVSIEDFINIVTVYDQCDSNGTHICWELNDQVITNTNDIVLLSRVCHIPQKIIQQFIPTDRDYALSELEAYLGFALNAFASLHQDINEKGCIECYALPLQWAKVKRASFQLTTPEYFLGDMRFNHLDSNDLIYSDIYQYNMWSKNASSNLDLETGFCFVAPEGTAIICLVIGQEVLITQTTDKQFFSESEIIRIKLVARRIAKNFGYFISEILFFYSEDRLSFGCISPYIIQSHQNSEFSLMVNHAITTAVSNHEKNLLI